MSSVQRSRSAVPLDQQSVLPTVRGVPWWGAVLLATVVTAIGAAIDANNTDSLGSVFKFCYLLGCVAAALAVRRRALFTAAAQPPLIAFLVGVITLYGLSADDSSGIKSLVFKVLLPIANDFPWMALTFLVTLVLVLARWFLTRESSGGGKQPAGPRSPAPSGQTSDDAAPTKRASSKRTAGSKAGAGSPTSPASRKAAASRHTAGAEQAAARTTTREGGEREAASRPRRSAMTAGSTTAGSDTPGSDTPAAPKRASSSSSAPATRRRSADGTPERSERPRPPSRAATTVGARPGPSPAPRGAESAQAPRRRATAGQVMRSEHGATLDGSALDGSAPDGSALDDRHAGMRDTDGQPPRRSRPRPVRDSEAYESRMGTSAYPSTRSRNRS